jgi:L-amino acid N-acyltransferase YncA
MENTVIRNVKKEDAGDIARIYNPYILNSVITFEEIPVSVEIIAGRIEAEIAASYPYLVLEVAQKVVGYAYAGVWRTRTAYRRTVESTVYLEQGLIGKGYGSLLYKALIEELRKKEFHVVLGGITLPNPASVALHEKMGFKKVAQYYEVGYKFGCWLDVGFWQLNLER